MKVHRISIRKFRSIDKCDLNLSDVAAVVGQNNSGKSAVLRALNVFFNSDRELRNFRDESNLYRRGSKPIIELTFNDLIDEPTFANRCWKPDTLVVRAVYQKAKRGQIKYEYKNHAGQYKAAPVKMMRSIRKRMRFVLIHAARDHSDTVAEESTLLREVLIESLRRHTANRDTLSPEIKKAVTALESRALRKVSDGLSNVYSNNHSFEFLIKHRAELAYDHLIDDLAVFVKEGGRDYSLNDCGNGVQSLVVIALYRFLASLTKRPIFLGIEEPETNLHPQAQKELYKNLKKGASDREIQVLFTTHSTVMLDRLEHEDVSLCQKVFDNVRGFRTEIKQLPEDFYTHHELTEDKYSAFFRYHNSEFFFSNHVIVVEGASDAAVVRQLAVQKKIDLDEYGVSILCLDAVDNLKYTFHLLRSLSIPYTIIIDKDFFLPYQNGLKDESRSGGGFFCYKKEFKNDKMIKALVSSASDRGQLLQLLHANHSKAMDLLETYSVICFKYNLEMDLIASKSAQSKFYSKYNLPSEKQNSKTLLVDFKQSIKKPDALVSVVKDVKHKNLPNSYKRIKKVISSIIKNID